MTNAICNRGWDCLYLFAMKWASKKAWIPGMAFPMLLMLLSTGCTKEELEGPSAASVLEHKAGLVTVMDSTGQGVVAPISDDGDDLGDRERSNRPR